MILSSNPEFLFVWAMGDEIVPETIGVVRNLEMVSTWTEGEIKVAKNEFFF